jgi:hypothetical protein
MRRALAGFGAAALLPFAVSLCGSVIGPCPSSDYDVCINQDLTVLETQYVQSHGNPRHVYVESWVVVTVNRHPQGLHVIADLQWWNKYSPEPHWATVNSETYGLKNLPASDGHPHRVNPRLEDACTPGRWRVVVHYTVKSSTGLNQHGTVYYPGPKDSSNGKLLKCKPPK